MLPQYATSYDKLIKELRLQNSLWKNFVIENNNSINIETYDEFARSKSAYLQLFCLHSNMTTVKSRAKTWYQ